MQEEQAAPLPLEILKLDLDNVAKPVEYIANLMGWFCIRLFDCLRWARLSRLELFTYLPPYNNPLPLMRSVTTLRVGRFYELWRNVRAPSLACAALPLGRSLTSPSFAVHLRADLRSAQVVPEPRRAHARHATLLRLCAESSCDPLGQSPLHATDRVERARADRVIPVPPRPDRLPCSDESSEHLCLRSCTVEPPAPLHSCEHRQHPGLRSASVDGRMRQADPRDRFCFLALLVFLSIDVAYNVIAWSIIASG